MDNVLYRPSWQKLRVSCIKDYNQFGGFQTADGATDNLNRLTNYLNDAASIGKGAAEYAAQEAFSMGYSISVEWNVRLYRIWNFIGSVINGFANQRLPHMATIREYYQSVTDIVNTSPVVYASDHWNWKVVEEELKQLWITERVWFQRIYDDMKERIVEKDQTTPDMLKFKGLMDAINIIQ